MPRTKWYLSTPFRIALLAEAIFVTAFLVIFGLLVIEMENEFFDQQELALNNEYRFLNDVYVQGGVWATVAAVERNTRANVKGRKIYLLTDSTGQKLAGNIDDSVLPSQWTLTDSLFELDADERYHSAAYTIGTMHLLLGVNGFEVSEIIARAMVTLIWSGLAVLMLSILAGKIIASRMNRRLNHVTDVLAHIAAGEFSARIEFANMSDDIGLMASQINRALATLETHIDGVKQVSADIAHDLRTPLTRLYILIASLEERSQADGHGQDIFDQITVQTQQINAIFDALLRITEIESGTLKDTFTSVPIQALCDEIFETYQAVCQDHGQSLTFESAVPINSIHGSHALIFQMIANLIENAVQHCPIDTHIRLVLAGNQISVIDDGPGIPFAEYDKVFQRLYRLDRSRNTPGTGLGLNFVQAIATVHGAHISLDDAAPGLKVTITFPK